jgi:hypothetical protein
MCALILPMQVSLHGIVAGPKRSAERRERAT